VAFKVLYTETGWEVKPGRGTEPTWIIGLKIFIRDEPERLVISLRPKEVQERYHALIWKKANREKKKELIRTIWASKEFKIYG
jgi:hypothetical protein